jgi:chromosome segregation ATPase
MRGQIQFPIPEATPPFDFSETNLVSLKDVFPDSKPADHRTLGERLMACRFELAKEGKPETIAKVEALLFEFADLEQRVNKFLTEQHDAQLSRLEAKRADLWAECRKLEDTNRAARNEVAALNNRLNARASDLSAARQKAAEANNAHFKSQFPNASEVAIWQAKRAGARTELATVEQQHQELQRELAAARAAHTEAAREFADRVEALRAVDTELIEYRKKT